MSYPGIYRAKGVKLDGTKLSAYIPQVFGDVLVTVEHFVGTTAGIGMGWVIFQGGSPEIPVWLGASVITTTTEGDSPIPGGTATQIWTWEGVVGDSAMTDGLELGRMGTNAVPSEATELFISKVDDTETIDQSYQIASLQPGDSIYLQYAPDAHSWHRYKCSGSPTRNGNTWRLPVITEDGSAPGTAPPVGSPVLVSFQPVITDGEPGPPGPPGDSGGFFTYIQPVPASVWVITHGLGYNPSVNVVDSAGDTVEGDVSYDNTSTVTLTFTGAFSGSAYLS